MNDAAPTTGDSALRAALITALGATYDVAGEGVRITASFDLFGGFIPNSVASFFADAILAGPFGAALAATPTPETLDWLALANDIRAVDGNHDLGAGALAEALAQRGWTREAPTPDTRLRECFVERTDCRHGVWESLTGDHFAEHLAATREEMP